MPLVSIPDELVGLNFITEVDQKTGFGKIKLPETATPKQKKAFKEYQKRCEQAQRNRFVIED